MPADPASMPSASPSVSALAFLGVTVLLCGCLATAPVTETPATATPSPSPSTQTATPPAPQASPGCPDGVSFWGLSGPSTEKQWAPDAVRIGYTLPGNASVFLVAYEGGTVLGHTHATNEDVRYPIASDGDEIRLEEPLEGTRTIRVAAVADANGNGVFEPATDPPCRSDDGGVVQAGPRTVDFGAFGTPAGSGE